MRCVEAQDVVMKYIDKDINDIELASLKQHMKNCKDCSNEFYLMRETVNLLENCSDAHPPDNFECSIMEKIEDINIYDKNKINKRGLFWFITGFILLNSLISLVLVKFMWNIILPETIIGSIVFSFYETFSSMFIRNYKMLLDIVFVVVGEYYYGFIFLIVMFYAFQKLLSTYVNEMKEGTR